MTRHVNTVMGETMRSPWGHHTYHDVPKATVARTRTIRDSHGLNLNVAVN